jgi:hypothetical protein
MVEIYISGPALLLILILILRSFNRNKGEGATGKKGHGDWGIGCIIVLFCILVPVGIWIVGFIGVIAHFILSFILRTFFWFFLPPPSGHIPHGPWYGGEDTATYEILGNGLSFLIISCFTIKCLYEFFFTKPESKTAKKRIQPPNENQDNSTESTVALEEIPTVANRIQVTCRGCGSTMNVMEKFAGKKRTCIKCKKVILIPELFGDS